MQFVDPHTFAVLGPSYAFRTTSSQLFNPSSAQAPFFQIFDQAFLTILGDKPSLNQVASNATFAFAHEAPIYNAETDEMFFSSNDGGPLGNSDINRNNQVGKINMKQVETALQGAMGTTDSNDVAATVNVPVTMVRPQTYI